MIFILVRKKREILFGTEIFHFDREHFIKYHIEGQPLRGSMNSARKKMKTNKGVISYKKNSRNNSLKKMTLCNDLNCVKTEGKTEKRREKQPYV